MADLTITSSQVLGDQNQHNQATKIAGVAISAGQSVYYDQSTGTLQLASATAGGGADPSAPAQCKGVALGSAAVGQPCTYQYDGDLTIGAGAAPTAGEIYVVSGATPGGIAPYADLVSDKYVTILGIGMAGNKIRLGIKASGITIP